MMRASLRCPACGAASTDPEFCSECGAAMRRADPGAAAAPSAPAAAQAATPAAAGGTAAVETCPVCGEPRPGPFARYCDTCRYDFLSKQPFTASAPVSASPVPSSVAQAAQVPGGAAGAASAVAPAAGPAPAAATSAVPPASAPVPTPPAQGVPALRWDLYATVDLSLRQDGDPMPADTRPRIFPLDLSDHLVGRRSDRDDVHPEVTINDPGISRRHVRFLRAPDGALSALDLGSMNGTRLNGTLLEPNVPTPLREGDELTLGCFTRLRVDGR